MNHFSTEDLPQLPRRRLGRTELDVSILGLGSGGASQLGQTDRERVPDVRKLIRMSSDLGVNLFDTAPSYGQSEDLLGAALGTLTRDSYVLTTKFHPIRGTDALLRDPTELRESLDTSLDRLRTDHIDVLFMHAVPPHLYKSLVDLYGETLERERINGRVRWLGISEAYASDHQHKALNLALEDDMFDVLMVGLNILSPSAGISLIPKAIERDRGVVSMCAVRSVLRDIRVARRIVARWIDDGVVDEDAIAGEPSLTWVLEDRFDSISDAAYSFASHFPGVSAALCGTGSPNHLLSNVISVLQPPLHSSTVQRIVESFGLVGINVGPETIGAA